MSKIVQAIGTKKVDKTTIEWWDILSRKKQERTYDALAIKKGSLLFSLE